MRWRRRVVFAALVAAVAISLVADPRAADARVTVFESDDGDQWVEFAGYLRSVSGVHALGYGEELFEPSSALNMSVARLRWNAGLGPDVELKLDQELGWRMASGATFGTGTGGGGATLFGVGASRVSDRTLDTEVTLADGTGYALTHDIDRLAVDIYTETADITIGRQGITWGKAAIFPVADLWSRFGPAEIDTEHKPGIDAARALIYPSMSTEVDLVVADRGSLENLSAGVRAAGTIDKLELFGAAGKFWDQVMAIAGATYVLDRVKLRAEAALPWHLDLAELRRPRGTAGVEWYGVDWALGAEYHYNGLGVIEPADYASAFSSAEFRRGETYFLGRHYAGVFASYNKIPDVELALSTIGNLTDPSVLVSPSVRYRVAQNTSLGLGAFVSAGREPTVGPQTSFDSEFGAYGNFYFVEFVSYY